MSLKILEYHFHPSQLQFQDNFQNLEMKIDHNPLLT